MRIEHIFLQVLILRIQFMYVQLVFAFASSYIAKFYFKKKSTGTIVYYGRNIICKALQ